MGKCIKQCLLVREEDKLLTVEDTCRVGGQNQLQLFPVLISMIRWHEPKKLTQRRSSATKGVSLGRWAVIRDNLLLTQHTGNHQKSPLILKSLNPVESDWGWNRNETRVVKSKVGSVTEQLLHWLNLKTTSFRPTSVPSCSSSDYWKVNAASNSSIFSKACWLVDNGTLL